MSPVEMAHKFYLGTSFIRHWEGCLGSMGDYSGAAGSLWPVYRILRTEYIMQNILNVVRSSPHANTMCHVDAMGKNSLSRLSSPN
jgi:hypothetical protein